ncbi:Ig-like domain-containing protein [Paraherbaspirillum soli]|uniref:Ig-like domain-containing protein n=1 Tax=Paraherbaspirillum soli TaxID=631222 RepID=A0ABW0MDX9_9BURK
MWWSKQSSRNNQQARMQSAAPAPKRRAPLIMPLEPRFMFDGAVAVAAAHADGPHPAAEHGHAAPDQLHPIEAAVKAVAAASAAPTTPRPAVLFIDARVSDPASLVKGVAAGTEVVYLQANQDGLLQIASYLAQHHEAGSVEIVAHGNDGELFLGSTDLNADNINAHAQTLAAIGGNLRQGADILLYACNTAADARGVAFVDTLAQLTGHNIAASSNATGVGGDWNLEVTTGNISAVPVLSAQALAHYDYSLGNTNVSTDAQLQAAIAADNASNSNDTITLTSDITFASAADTLVINHTGSGTLTIDGGGHTINGNYLNRIISISAGHVIIENVTIEHGLLAGAGGAAGHAGSNELGAGISNAGILTLNNVIVTQNVATGGGGGGGVSISYVGGGGGGGGGASGRGGAAGGIAGPGTGNYAGAAGSGSSGGRGGSYDGIHLDGSGGTSSGGGAGGNSGSTGYSAGGNGATASGGGLTIGGGGGGGGWDATGGTGGNAAGGIFNSGTLYVIGSSAITNNLGAAGGAGGGGGSGNHGGVGGQGVGGIWNSGGGTLEMTASAYAAMSGNVGSSGSIGGVVNGGNNTGVTSPTAAARINTGSGIINTNYVPPAPVVSSIAIVGGSPNNAGSEQFTVTFSESVTGVDISDFTLTDTGTAAGTIASVSGSGSTYTVTVNGVSGDGTMRLDLNSSGTGITDGSSTPIASGYTSGQVYTLDHTAPTVSSINRVGSSTNNAGSEQFTVTFSESVTGVDISDFTLTDGGTATGTIASVSGSGSTYTVTVNGVTGDGTMRLDLNSSGTGIADAATNAIAAGFTSGQSYTLDHTAPSVSSITRVGSSTNNANSEQFTVTFSESVTGVDISDFTLTNTGTAAGTIASVSGSGNTYTVTVNGVTGDGTMRLDLNSSGTGIADSASNAIAAGFTAGQAYTLEHTPPSVTSINRVGSSTNNAGSEQFTVTFSESVTGVDISDFTLTNTGGVTGTIASVSGSGSTYTVTVNGVSGDGTMRLDLNSSGTGIADAASNAIAAGFTSGQVYTLDHTAPTVSSITRVGSSVNNAGSEQFTVTFSESVTGVDISDFTLTNTGTAAGTIASVSGSGSTYTVTVNGVTGDGTMRLDLNSSGTGIADAATNAIAAGFTSGQIYTLDHTAPTVSSINRVGSSTNNANSEQFTVTFSESVTGVDISDFTLTNTGGVTGTIASVSGSGSTYTVTVNGVTGDGTMRLDLNSSGTGIADAASNAIAAGFTSGQVYTLDHTAPTVSSITRVGSSVNNANSEQFTVTFSESVTGVDISDFTLTNTGTAAGTIASVSGSGNTYTVTVNGVTGDGTMRLDLNSSGTGIADAAGNAIAAGFTAGQAYTLEHTPPTVTSVGVPANATYIAGQNLDFTVNFSEAVTVIGTPEMTLTLDTGGTVHADYLSGSGTSALTFRYTIVSGEMDATGVAVGGSLIANGGTVRDAAGNDALLTLNSVASTAGVLVDSIAPTVSSVGVPANGTYGAGQDLVFTVNFSENVVVDTGDGTPYLSVVLDTGGTVHATYIGGSGTSALSFRYTVASGNNDSDGIVLGAAISANGGTIKDAATNAAVLTLNSVASTTGVLVDAIPPTVSSIHTVAGSPNNLGSETFTVTFSSAVTGVDISDFTLHDSGTATGTIASVSGSGSTYTVTINGVTGDGTMRLDLNSSGTGITDAFGNAIATGFTGGQSYTLDHTQPAVTGMTVPANGTYGVGQNLDFTVTFSEAVTVSGTPRIAITLDTGGTVYANYLAGSGSTTLTFRLTVVGGEQDLTGIATAAAIDANGGAIRDAAANNALLNLGDEPSTAGIDIDAVPPVVQSVGVPANGTYGTGQDLDFTVDFNKVVTVNTGGGVPYLSVTLDTGGTVHASYVSGSGTSTLTFRYQVVSGNDDSDGIALGASLTVNGGTIRDATGNDATLTLNSVASTAGVLVDAIPPTVSAIHTVAGSPNNLGSETFTVTFSSAVTGVDISDFTLHDSGTAAGTIASVSGSGSTYTVTVNGVSGDGTMRLDLNNSGTGITDAFGNAIATGFTAGQSYTLDHTSPTVTGMTVPANGTYVAGQNLDFTVTFSEAVTISGTPRIAITLDTGGTVYADYLAGSGSTTLAFRLTVAAGEQDLTGIVTAASIDANGGAIRDAAANNALLNLGDEPSTTGIQVDAIAPIVASVEVPANGTYGAGQTLDFTVNLSKNVTLDTSGGTPYITLTLDNGGTVDAFYIAGSGSSALTFRYTVAAGNLDTDGIALGSTMVLNGATMVDAHGNAALPALAGVASTAGVLVDAVSPVVSAIAINGPSLTNAASVTYTVTFSENVTGVDASDFTLSAGGSVVGHIASVAALNGHTYTVTVDGISGDGALRLDLNGSGTGIADLASNPIATGFTGGAAYTFDHAAPTVVSVGVPAAGTYLAGQTLDFTVNFDQAVIVGAGGTGPRIALTLADGGTVYADYVAGSGSNTLTFRYVVAAGNRHSDGIGLASALNLNGSSLQDALGNNADPTLHGVGPTANIDVGPLPGPTSTPPIAGGPGRGLLERGNGLQLMSAVDPFIWVLPTASAPAQLPETMPATAQATWSSVPLLSAGQQGYGHVDAGVSRGSESAVGSTGFSSASPSFIHQLVSPPPTELVALGSAGIDRSDNLSWQAPPAAEQTPEPLLMLREQPAERPLAELPPPLAGKASLNEQFARYGQAAREREKSALLNHARRHG